MSRPSKIRKPRGENLGSATGSTKTVPSAKWAEQLANAEELASFDMTATDTVDQRTKSLSSEPTSSASSTTETSLPRTADKLGVDSYQPGEPLQLRPEHLPKLSVLANGLGTTLSGVIERIMTIVMPGQGNWSGKTVGDVIDFYLANFYYA